MTTVSKVGATAIALACLAPTPAAYAQSAAPATDRLSDKRLAPAALAALAALARYRWPGNVRQLRSVLACACTTTAGDEIQARDLDLPLRAVAPDDRPGQESPRDLSLREVERRAILSALAEANGSRSRAATRLGIHRSTLRRRLRELDIDPAAATRGHNDDNGHDPPE